MLSFWAGAGQDFRRALGRDDWLAGPHHPGAGAVEAQHRWIPTQPFGNDLLRRIVHDVDDAREGAVFLQMLMAQDSPRKGTISLARAPKRLVVIQCREHAARVRDEPLLFRRGGAR